MSEACRSDSHARHDRHSPATGKACYPDLFGVETPIIGKKDKCSPSILKSITQHGCDSVIAVTHAAGGEGIDFQRGNTGSVKSSGIEVTHTDDTCIAVKQDHCWHRDVLWVLSR